jgi:DnaJ-class molecular chaperone
MSGIGALKEFQQQYPMVTSGDMQAFVLGYKAAFKDYQNGTLVCSQCGGSGKGPQLTDKCTECDGTGMKK